MSNFPQFTAPLVDPSTGKPTREWWLFLQHMWERTGGLTDMTDIEAVGLSRNRLGNAGLTPDAIRLRTRRERKADEIIPRRVRSDRKQPEAPVVRARSDRRPDDAPRIHARQARKTEEAAPPRHAFPRLVLTKEAYKPLTLIRLYTGLTADIPTGWQLADGTNGTPNMKDLFVVGAGNLYAKGTTGGSTTITANNLPTHTHPYNDKDTTYTANTVAVQSGAGTTVVQSLTSGGGDTARTSGNNTTTATPYLPPYYAVAYIINTSTVTVVTDAKLR